MHLKFYYLIILFLFYSTQALTQVPEEFKEDCPENSRCSKIGADAYLKWERILKSQKGPLQNKILENLWQQAGVPIPLWSFKKDKEPSPLIPFLSWDSACPNHRPPNPEVFLSLVFIPHLPPAQFKVFTKKLFSEGLALNLAVIKKGPSQFILWPIPRGEAPLYLKKDGGLFITDFEGHYFYYDFSYQGLNQSIKPQAQNENAKNIPSAIVITCPQDLIQFYQKNLPSPSPVTAFYCKSIWDKDANLFREVIFGKGCP